MNRLNVGCDIAKSKIDVCVLGHDRKTSLYATFENNFDGFTLFVDFLSQNFSAFIPYVGFESTSNYMISFQRFLSDNAIPHVLYNPKRVSKYVKSLVIQGKTDRSDSYAIAHFTSLQPLEDFTCDYSVDRETLSKFNTSLSLLSKVKTQLKNLTKSMSNGVENIALLDSVSGALHDIEKHEKKMKKDASSMLYDLYPFVSDIESKYQGVGCSLLLLLIPKIYESVDRYSDSQIVAFLGLNPVPFESGQMKLKQKMNIFGDSKLKQMIYLASMASIRLNPILKEKYQSLVSRGKPKKVALIAVSRKLLLAIIKDVRRYKKSL